MSLTEPSGRRLLPVRLSGIRPEVRNAAARTACKVAKTEDERAELLSAALNPSDTAYYVTPDALPLLREIAA